MEFEKYTERLRGFIQSAQTLAMREGHQQFTPLHILRVLLDDKEGLCAGLIAASGGDAKEISVAIDITAMNTIWLRLICIIFCRIYSACFADLLSRRIIAHNTQCNLTTILAILQ